jgi:hypothetical protein
LPDLQDTEVNSAVLDRLVNLAKLAPEGISPPVVGAEQEEVAEAAEAEVEEGVPFPQGTLDLQVLQTRPDKF